MTFKKFQYNLLTRADIPRVSLYTNKAQMFFNRGAINLMALLDKDYVVLYYDQDYDFIGISKTEKEDPGALKMHVDRSGSRGVITCRSFLRYYNISVDATTQYLLKQTDDDETMFYFDLNHIEIDSIEKDEEYEE